MWPEERERKQQFFRDYFDNPPSLREREWLWKDQQTGWEAMRGYKRQKLWWRVSFGLDQAKDSHLQFRCSFCHQPCATTESTLEHARKHTTIPLPGFYLAKGKRRVKPDEDLVI